MDIQLWPEDYKICRPSLRRLLLYSIERIGEKVLGEALYFFLSHNTCLPLPQTCTYIRISQVSYPS
jgi:hypothetical protein